MDGWVGVYVLLVFLHDWCVVYLIGFSGELWIGGVRDAIGFSGELGMGGVRAVLLEFVWGVWMGWGFVCLVVCKSVRLGWVGVFRSHFLSVMICVGG